jgi:glycosyltransferase involved in cell wall biosynthesis
MAISAPHPTTGAPPPRLCVGLPVYNGAKWLAGALDSCLGQGFRDFEVVVADNASTDATEAIARDYAARDARVRYHRNARNLGLYANFDLVFALSRAPYFKWAAVSDLCADGFFERCVAALEARPDAVLAYPRAWLVGVAPDGGEFAEEYEDGLDLPHERAADRYRAYLERERFNNVMHGVIRAAALRGTAMHRPYPGSDISLMAELALRGKFIEVPERLFVRRFTPETTSILMTRGGAARLAMPTAPRVAQRINLHAHRFVAVARAPVAFGEKLRAWAYLLRRVMRLRHQVLRWLTRPPG